MLPLRVRHLDRVQLHVDLAILARLADAVVRADAGERTGCVAIDIAPAVVALASEGPDPLGSSSMTEGGQQGAEQEPSIVIEPAMMAGVWSNMARVGHSPYEFTLDFIRLDYGHQPPTGIVVARVSLSPLLVTQLIEALSANWAIYAERSMPPEVQQHGRATTDDGGEPDKPDSRGASS